MVSSRRSSRTNTREQCAPYVTTVACGKPKSGVFLTEKMIQRKILGVSEERHSRKAFGGCNGSCVRLEGPRGNVTNVRYACFVVLSP